MAETRVCSTCGAEIPAGAAAGGCIACLLRLADQPQATASDAVTVISPGALPAPAAQPRELEDYELIEELGSGGMGEVYRARQMSLGRLVALKLVKPGMDSGQVLARFDAERHALAMMDHPHIARVFDAGRTRQGRPYFVMELVEGIPITRFCDQHKLSVRQRLELFVPVCQAIQHAHQKGIIHRDIKPGNVLVTMQDGKPCPKVIDFGIAKALGPRLTGETIATELGMIIGTLEYMAPEQAGLNQLDIDTRADVYALGVLLYELLTGTTPLNRKSLRQAAFDEVLRRIREEEPPRPSTRLLDTRDTLPDAAAKRGIEPSRLPRALQGDVDWIVMRALEKDRARRYETADNLARDIVRHLRDEPVLAGPPTRGYRLKKFVRKHRSAVAAAAAFVFLLGAAAIVSTVLAVRAERARKVAAKAESEAQSVLRFFQDRVLSATRPVGERGGLGHDVTIRQALAAAESTIADSFADAPVVEASIRDVLGTSLLDLEDYTNALAQHSRALELFRQQSGPEAPRALSAMNNMAQSLPKLGREAEALDLLQRVLAIRRRTLGNEHPDTLVSMNNLASAYYEFTGLRDRSAALALHEETWNIRKRILGPTHRYTLSSMSSVGNCLRSLGRLEEAIPHLEETLRLHRAVLGPTNRYTTDCLSHLAGTYQRAGRHADALPLLRELLALTRLDRPPEHRYTAQAVRDLAYALIETGNPGEACDLFEEQLAVETRFHGPSDERTIKSRVRLAEAQRAAGRHEPALTNAAMALGMVIGMPRAERATLDRGLEVLTESSIALARPQEVLPLLDRFLGRFGKSFVATHPASLDRARKLINAALSSAQLETEARARARALLDQLPAATNPASPAAPNP